MTELFASYIETAPNDLYKKFFQKLSEFDNTPVSEWTNNELLGFLVSTFYKTTKKPYGFKYNTEAPSKCYELFLIKKLKLRISQDNQILKSFISWIIENKLGSKKIRTLALFVDDKNIQDFNMKFMANQISQKISRTDVLSQSIASIVSQYNQNIKTYGDISFFYNAYPDHEMFGKISSQEFEDIKKVL